MNRSLSNRYSLGRRMTPQSPYEALQPDAAPPPPPPLPPSRKRRRLSALSGLLSFVLIVAMGAMLALVWGDRRLHEPGPLTDDKIVFIPKGGTGEIVERLSEQGVIDSPLILQVAVVFKNLRGDKERLKAGEYIFKRHASIQDVLATLVSGKQNMHPITVPEGLTSQQILARLHESDVLTGEVRDIPKEGSILPETYKVERGMSRADLITKMKEDDRRTVEQIWARRSPDLPLRSPYEMVTLASIVEKETGKADERSRVAAVFINRLRKRMRLQSDPTIVYGLVGGQGTLGHSISRSELDKPTPYNTYTIDGLPPGPIDNPGRAALEAVANPSRTGDLYFVADGTGGHAFAETLDQHAKNVQRWRQLERDAKEKGASDVDKLNPSALPIGPNPLKPNQRSDASDSVYGDLPDRFDTAAPKIRVASFLDPAATHSIDAMVGDSLASTPTPDRLAAGMPGRIKGSAAGAMFDLRTGLEGLNVATETPSPPATSLDGPLTTVSDDPAPATDTFPMTPAQRAEDKARAVRIGVDPSSAVRTASMPTPPAHPKIYDVSEGTKLDPLRDRGYDLNSAKTVPDFGKLNP